MSTSTEPRCESPSTTSATDTLPESIADALTEFLDTDVIGINGTPATVPCSDSDHVIRPGDHVTLVITVIDDSTVIEPRATLCQQCSRDPVTDTPDWGDRTVVVRGTATPTNINGNGTEVLTLSDYSIDAVHTHS